MLFGRFETESSLWGPFLSMVNGEQARQSDRRYWHLSSNGTALSEGEDTYTHILHCDLLIDVLFISLICCFIKLW